MHRLIKKTTQYFEFKLIGLLASIYFLIVLVNFLKNAYLKINGYRFQSHSWSELIFVVSGEDYLVVVIYIIFASALSKMLFIKKVKLYIVVIVHLILGFFLGPYIYFSTSLIGILLGHGTIQSFIDDYFLIKFIAVVDLNLIVYATLIIVSYIYYYFMEVIENEKIKANLEKQLNSTKLQALRSQLKPHFLFNTLNSIHSLVCSKPEISKKLLGNITDLLEEVTELSNENQISLEKEVDIFQKYLNIVQTRFTDDLTIIKEIDNNLLKTYVPPLLLQPIVENSIKHGYSSTILSIEIIIKIFKEKNFLKIEIKNNGEKLTKNFNYIDSEGTGVRNLVERLKALYPENYHFEMKNVKNGVVTEIKIPFKTIQ